MDSVPSYNCAPNLEVYCTAHLAPSPSHPHLLPPLFNSGSQPCSQPRGAPPHQSFHTRGHEAPGPGHSKNTLAKTHQGQAASPSRLPFASSFGKIRLLLARRVPLCLWAKCSTIPAKFSKEQIFSRFVPTEELLVDTRGRALRGLAEGVKPRLADFG